MRLRACLHDLLFEFITGEIGRGADVWRVLDGVSTQVKYLGIVTARAGHCQHVRMTIWMTRTHRSRPRSRGAPWGGVSDMSGHHPGHCDISPGPWPCITRHKHQGWSPDYDPHQEKLYSNMRVKSNKRSVCVRRCFLIISVTIMNCFNVVNVVLVSWDQLPGPGDSGAPWKPINGHQGREAGGAIPRLPNTPPRQQDMEREREHLEKTWSKTFSPVGGPSL